MMLYANIPCYIHGELEIYFQSKSEVWRLQPTTSRTLLLKQLGQLHFHDPFGAFVSDLKIVNASLSVDQY